MIRKCFRSGFVAAVFLGGFAALPACAPTPGGVYPGYQPQPGQGVFPNGQARGRYVVPENLRPQPPRSLSPADECNALLYQGLRGQHEGSIYLQGLPGRQRVLKPAFSEDFDEELFNGQLTRQPPLYEVREYLAGQRIYNPSINTITDGLRLGPVMQDRLTIELDAEGYVQDLRCE
jgi:hypothetical protein